MSIEIRELMPVAEGREADPIIQQATELLLGEVLISDRPVTDEDRQIFVWHIGRELKRVYARVEGSLVLAAAEIELAPDYTFLTTIATHPDYRHRRHGSALIRHIAQETIANDPTGENRVILYAETPAREFYDKLGFEEVTERIPGEDDYTELVANPQDILSKTSDLV